MSEEIGEILVQADDLQHRIREMAEDISRDYQGQDLLLIGVLKGAFLFLADLMRHLEVGCEVDFMAVASYGSSTESSGVVRILKDLEEPLEGRNVLIVEDIVDSGLTLQYLMRTLETAYHKLRPGSRIVLETINPACWFAFFSSYIRDLTHVQPLHPDTLTYLLTASGSGLDPDLSPAAALAQVPRIARVRRLPERQVRALVARAIDDPLLGDRHVNVLALNRALDAAAPR